MRVCTGGELRRNKGRSEVSLERRLYEQHVGRVTTKWEGENRVSAFTNG